MNMTLRAPRADNTIEPNLVPPFKSPSTLNPLAAVLAPLAAFSLRIEPDPLRPRATVVVTKVTVGSGTQTNPSNWELGDTTATGISVFVNLLENSYHASNDQVQQGNGPDAWEIAAASNLANSVADAWTSRLTAANGFGTQSIGAAADFSPDDLATLYALARDWEEVHLILDHAYLAQMIPTNRNAYTAGEWNQSGFTGIYTQNRWSTEAQSGIVGFLCSPQALAVVTGLGHPPKAGVSYTDERLAPLGIAVRRSSWYNTATRADWRSLELMFGASVGDAARGVILTSA